MDELNKIIARLQKQLKELTEKCNAQEDEIALLNDEIRKLKKARKPARL